MSEVSAEVAVAKEPKYHVVKIVSSHASQKEALKAVNSVELAEDEKLLKGKILVLKTQTKKTL